MLAPAWSSIIANSAKMNRIKLKVPTAAKPSAEPTRMGETLASRNFGLEARKRILALDFIFIAPYIKAVKMSMAVMVAGGGGFGR